jgi:methyl-accepting chemotaxis protein
VGTTIQEVVAALRRVSDLLGEISAASQEQSQGVAVFRARGAASDAMLLPA